MIVWMGFASFLITFYHKNVPKESEKGYADNFVNLVDVFLKHRDNRKPMQGQDDLKNDEWRVIDKEGGVVIL